MAQDYKLDQVVYHKDVYDYKEPLKIVGIRKDELELEGDYSGGTNQTVGQSWLPIEGVSEVYEYGRKVDMRNDAQKVGVKHVSSYKNNEEMMNTIHILVNYVLYLTGEVSS